MKKHRLFMLIIFVGTIIQFVLNNFVFSRFPGILSFILLVPFYLIVYIYYQRYKYIKYICFVSIFTVMANLFLLDYLNDFAMYTPKIRLIGMVSYFGSLINLLLGFIMLLQNEPKRKLIKGLFAFIIITNYVFFSYYFFPISGLVVAFFGPADQAVEITLIVLQIIQYVLQIFIMIAQLILIYILGSEEAYYQKARNNDRPIQW